MPRLFARRTDGYDWILCICHHNNKISSSPADSFPDPCLYRHCETDCCPPRWCWAGSIPPIDHRQYHRLVQGRIQRQGGAVGETTEARTTPLGMLWNTSTLFILPLLNIQLLSWTGLLNISIFDMKHLVRIAEEFNIAVVVINQCMADPGAHHPLDPQPDRTKHSLTCYPHPLLPY